LAPAMTPRAAHPNKSEAGASSIRAWTDADGLQADAGPAVLTVALGSDAEIRPSLLISRCSKIASMRLFRGADYAWRLERGHVIERAAVEHEGHRRP
jgi:hypothetical protein